jgi:hypothetical protein
MNKPGIFVSGLVFVVAIAGGLWLAKGGPVVVAKLEPFQPQESVPTWRPSDAGPDWSDAKFRKEIAVGTLYVNDNGNFAALKHEPCNIDKKIDFVVAQDAYLNYYHETGSKPGYEYVVDWKEKAMHENFFKSVLNGYIPRQQIDKKFQSYLPFGPDMPPACKG